MPWEAWITLCIVLLTLGALARNLAKPDIILMGSLTLLLTLSLFSDRFPPARQVAAAFGNEALLTVGVLFVVAAGLTETGAIGLLTGRLLGRPTGVPAAQLRMMLPVVGLSAFLNNTPVVAMFMPAITEWCRKTRISPSKLLMPLSYAAILGGTCTLIGTSTNLVVQGMLIEGKLPRMGMFTLAWIGVPAAVVGIAYILASSRWLLPDRSPPRVQLADERQYTVEMLVQPGSTVDGQSIEKAGLRHLPGCYLVEIERGGELLVAPQPQQVLRGGDRLVFVGVVESVVDLQKIRGLAPATNQVYKLDEPRHNRRLVEAVVSSACPIVGQTIREGQFRTRYGAVVIAVHRSGHRIAGKIGDIVLRPGDTLLLETHPAFPLVQRNSRDFFLVSAIEDSQPRRHDKAWIAIAVLAAMVAAMSLESFTSLSVLNVTLLAAGALLATRCLSGAQARRAIDFETLLAIGASFGIGRAMDSTGLATAVAGWMTGLFQFAGPWGILAGIYLMTLIFTELVTNNAAAVLAFPIAKAAAAGVGASFMPFAVCIALAASHGYATPLGYQTHLMVYGPGGYRFGDFVRMGVPLDLLMMTLAVGLAPVFFPF